MIGPEIWGPHGWKFIHYVALSYPDKPTNEDKINYKNFFINLKNILPCHTCRNNYTTHLSKLLNDNIFISNDTLLNWTIDLHNIVNKQHNKKTYTYNEARKLIYDDYKKKEINWSLVFVLGGLIAIGILYKKN